MKILIAASIPVPKRSRRHHSSRYLWPSNRKTLRDVRDDMELTTIKIDAREPVEK